MARPVGSKSTVPSKADLKNQIRILNLQMDAMYRNLGEIWRPTYVNKKLVLVSSLGRIKVKNEIFVPDMSVDHTLLYDGVPVANIIANTFLRLSLDTELRFKDFNSHNCAVDNLVVVNG